MRLNVKPWNMRLDTSLRATYSGSSSPNLRRFFEAPSGGVGAFDDAIEVAPALLRGPAESSSRHMHWIMIANCCIVAKKSTAYRLDRGTKRWLDTGNFQTQPP